MSTSRSRSPTRKTMNAALDEVLREHERRMKRLGRPQAAAVLVAAGRLLLMELGLANRVKVERTVEDLLP